MLTKYTSPKISLGASLLGLALCLYATWASAATTAVKAQQRFPSAEAAAQALLTAAQAEDPSSGLLLLFGPGGKDVLSTGDPAQDENYRATFVEKAKASMKLEKDPMNANRVFIAIGEDAFPFAIPLARAADGQWRFDMDEGKFEVLARRIGSNELDAIDVCNGYVASQREYAGKDHTQNNVRQYAQSLVSSPGKDDGLYQPQSPKAPAIPISATPYHGYYFKILKAQGPNAAGGAKDYLLRGMMIGGFGLIAWPEKYGVSAIKTFMVNQDGIIYEKDLGPGTSTIAQGITKFNPDKTWRPVR